MDLDTRTVADVMRSEVVTLAPDDRLDLAGDVMKLGRIRHMPVVDEGRLVGIVSNRDLLAASLSRALEFKPEQRRAFLRSVEVEEVMARGLVTVGPETSLREAARLLVEHKIGCLPVVDTHGALVGLLSEADLIRETLLAADA